MQNRKSYAEISCVRLVAIPAKNENFDVKKWFQVSFFGQALSDFKKMVIQWFHKNSIITKCSINIFVR